MGTADVGCAGCQGIRRASQKEGADPRKGMANMEPCTFSAVENALGLATPGKGNNPTDVQIRAHAREHTHTHQTHTHTHTN